MFPEVAEVSGIVYRRNDNVIAFREGGCKGHFEAYSANACSRGNRACGNSFGFGCHRDIQTARTCGDVSTLALCGKHHLAGCHIRCFMGGLVRDFFRGSDCGKRSVRRIVDDVSKSIGNRARSVSLGNANSIFNAIANDGHLA